MVGSTLRCCIASLPFAFANGCDGDVTVYLGKRPHAPVHGSMPTADGGVSFETSAGGVDAAPTATQCGAGITPGLRTSRLESRGVERQAYVSVPADFEPGRSYPIVFGFHARDETGLGARTYLDLERVVPGWALFVYPNALVQTFNGDDVAAGWQNGPNTVDYGGTDDLVFVRALLDELEREYCIDRDLLFSTGLGWGGDFSSVLGCYAGDLFRGVAPVAANSPYFLPTNPNDVPCSGEVGVWVFHGRGDDYFPLDFGLRNAEFWRQANDCDETGSLLVPDGAGDEDECTSFSCSGPPVRQCWYGADLGHRVPDAYYSSAVIEFFRGL